MFRGRGGVALEGKQPGFLGCLSQAFWKRGSHSCTLYRGLRAFRKYLYTDPVECRLTSRMLNAWPWCFLVTWQTNFKKQDGRRGTRAEKSRMVLSGPRCSHPGDHGNKAVVHGVYEMETNIILANKRKAFCIMDSLSFEEGEERTRAGPHRLPSLRKGPG